MRGQGSDGGHNGLKHINQILQTTQYARLRFGISAEFSKGQQVDYVLGIWSPEENQVLSEHIERASKAVFSFGLIGLARTMNEVNTK
jgi:PTH1 family peptidyl-tRNA hydrolase